LKYLVGSPYGAERQGLAWERNHSYHELAERICAKEKHVKPRSVTAVDEGQMRTIQRERVDGAATAEFA